MKTEQMTLENCEEMLLRELEKYPNQKLEKDDVYRVAEMVREYQGRIKAYLHEQQEKKVTSLDRLADKVARFGGSWGFIAILAFIIASWVVLNFFASWNTLFILSFCMSCMSVFTAPFILMSQNRQAVKNKQEQMLDIAINFKAEQENMEIQSHLKQILERMDRLEELQSGRGRETQREGNVQEKLTVS
ncbi:DUF1003 domain-containing protein [Paenibacillus sp. CC-CFT747]|nr:DUF1003 domain-containing protein [Paenibacillus sp. CC-CFT747]